MDVLGKKLSRFIVEHGYTCKGWLIALVICPPAAVFIPFKMPSTPMAARVAMVVLTVSVHTLLVTGSFVVIGALIVRAIRSIIAW